MNSSIAASIIAPRRSAARSARLETGFDGSEPADALAPDRLLAGFGADFLGPFVFPCVMILI